MEILVCVKRVPTVGGAITLTADRRAIDTKDVGLHDQPARGVRGRGGGPAGRAVRRVGDGADARARSRRGAASRPAWRSGRRRRCSSRPSLACEVGPIATAGRAARGGGHGWPFDLVLLGNEASDTGDYQVGIRLAHLLGWPVATGIKALSVDDGAALGAASRTYRGVLETFALAAAVRGDRQGGHQPAALPVAARSAAGQAGGDRRGCRVARSPAAACEGSRMTSLRVPDAPTQQATVLGQGADGGARPGRRVLAELGVLS